MKIDLNLDKKYSVFIDELHSLKLSGKVAIVTNPKVGGLWLDFLLQRLDCEQKFIITIPDGEEYKNTASVEQIFIDASCARICGGCCRGGKDGCML